VPPVRPKSAGYVFYAGCLAFIIPAIILSTLYVAIAVRQFIYTIKYVSPLKPISSIEGL
jgi:hypothetical protein